MSSQLSSLYRHGSRYSKAVLNNNIHNIKSTNICALHLHRHFASKVFERTKAHNNVGTIGHVDHGKTTLSSAITRVVSERGGDGDVAVFTPFEKIDRATEEISRGITINSCSIEYETAERHYSHTDCPGHRDYVKNMITGCAQLETAILVVAATDGVCPQTKEHILLAKQIGIPNLIVYLNKVDIENDPELLELVEMEITELLEQYEFDVSKIPFVHGSALCAMEGKHDEIGKESILQLLGHLDGMPIPTRDDAKPFMLPIENIYSLRGIGTVVTGKVEQGTIKAGESVEIVGIRKSQKSTVAGVEMFQKQVKSGQTGDNLGLCLRGVDSKVVRRGQFVIQPGSRTTNTEFRAQCYFLTAEEGGRTKPMKGGYKPQFYLKTANITGKLGVPDDRDIITPGDHCEIFVELEVPGVVWPQLRFAMREGGNTVAVGVVTQVM